MENNQSNFDMRILPTSRDDGIDLLYSACASRMTSVIHWRLKCEQPFMRPWDIHREAIGS